MPSDATEHKTRVSGRIAVQHVANPTSGMDSQIRDPVTLHPRGRPARGRRVCLLGSFADPAMRYGSCHHLRHGRPIVSQFPRLQHRPDRARVGADHSGRALLGHAGVQYGFLCKTRCRSDDGVLPRDERAVATTPPGLRRRCRPQPARRCRLQPAAYRQIHHPVLQF